MAWLSWEKDSINTAWSHLFLSTFLFSCQLSFVPEVAIFVADAGNTVEEEDIPTMKVAILSQLLLHTGLCNVSPKIYLIPFSVRLATF